MCLGGVFTELARGIHFFAKHILIADAQHVAVTDADAQQHFVLGREILAVTLAALLHGNRAAHGVVDRAVDHHQAVALGL